MLDTTLCAYCGSVIPASAKTCPMCGADVAPDFLEPPTLTELTDPAFQAPAPPVAPPPQAEPLEQPFTSAQYTPPTASNRSWIILAGVMGVVVVCLCLLAVILTVAF